MGHARSVIQSNRAEKLLGWGGFDDHLSAHKITVILKNMFLPEDLKNGIITKEELKQDVTMECEKLGELERVVVYEHHPDGVISVRFRSEEAAASCIAKMHGRYFSQRQISAHKWGTPNSHSFSKRVMLDGFTKYHRSEKGVDEETRLEQYAKDLEKGV